MKRLKLKGAIVSVYDTEGEFAKAIGVSRATVSATVNGRHTPQTQYWDKWAEALKIPKTELVNLFFDENV